MPRLTQTQCTSTQTHQSGVLLSQLLASLHLVNVLSVPCQSHVCQSLFHNTWFCVFNGYDWLVFPGVKLSNEILCSLKVVGNCNQWICPSLETRPSKNRKGLSGKRGGMKVYTVECGTHIRMLIKSQSEVRLHTKCSVHFHPSWFTRPSFLIFWGSGSKTKSVPC